MISIVRSPRCIERLVTIAEENADVGYKISRIQLLKFDRNQHFRAEAQLAAARLELDWIRDDLKESIEDMNRLEKLRKAINDCINAGHKNLENLALL